MLRVSPDRRIAGSPDRRIAGSPDRRIAGSPDRRIPFAAIIAQSGRRVDPAKRHKTLCESGGPYAQQ
jgi:hypothetical protein